LAFQVLVGVQVLAGGVDVAVAEQLLDGDDVVAAGASVQPSTARSLPFLI
jgi:hypothetical protein